MSLIGTLADFPDNRSYAVEANGLSLLVVRRGDEVFIYQNRCPHTQESLDPMGGSVASDDGLLITCQRHAATFVTDTGECVGGPCLGEHLEPMGFTLSQESLYLD